MLDGNEMHRMDNEKEPAMAKGSLLSRAAAACSQGDDMLGVHLYLAAFEEALVSSGDLASWQLALDGLHQAWDIALDLGERCLAEYVFERLEPYLSKDEIDDCLDELQSLAFDKLEELGLSRDELEHMASMVPAAIAEAEAEMAATGNPQSANAVKIISGAFGLSDEPVATEQPAAMRGEGAAVAQAAEAGTAPEGAVAEGGAAEGAAAEGADATQTAATGEGGEGASESGAQAGVEAEAGVAAETEKPKRSSFEQVASLHALPSAHNESANDASGQKPRPVAHIKSVVSFDASAIQGAGKPEAPKHPKRPGVLTYDSLVGYDTAVDTMRRFGIGMQKDPQFNQLVNMLNARHGLDHVPATDAFMFVSPVREDANRFIEATLGEIGLPGMRMRMEEGAQGMPLLCVTTQAGNQPHLNPAKNAFEGPGVLILEDLDLWTPAQHEQMPAMPEDQNGLNSFLMATLSRGARDVVTLIRNAVENPQVYVLASMSSNAQLDPFFYSLLDPIMMIELDYPTPRDRRMLWKEAISQHPSLRGLDLDELVALSENMARYDIVVSAREAVEEAYRESLFRRCYVPVSKRGLYEKIASFQPLDSNEYAGLESSVIRDFGNELGELDALLDEWRAQAFVDGEAVGRPIGAGEAAGRPVEAVGAEDAAPAEVAAEVAAEVVAEVEAAVAQVEEIVEKPETGEATGAEAEVAEADAEAVRPTTPDAAEAPVAEDDTDAVADAPSEDPAAE